MQFEQERGHVASAVECYMKKHGLTDEEASHELRKQVDDAWKDMYEELLHRTIVIPTKLLIRILNCMRMLDIWYEELDTYAHSRNKMKDMITSGLVNPLPILV